jgi:exosome complex component RRP45
LRKIDIKFGQNTIKNKMNKNGQVLVQFGHTKILTQTQLKLCSPNKAKPQEGFFKFNVEFDCLNHMAEFANQTQTLQEMKVEIQSFIEKITRNSRATDKEGLCIISGKLVWSITVTLHLLNDDGNTFDAFFLAAILALKNTRLPEVTMARDKVKINDEKLKYLNVHHIPISTTFYFIKDMPSDPILDVNAKEERLCSSRFSIAMNSYEDICGMCTLGALDMGGIKDEESDDGAGMNLAQVNMN